MFSEKSLNRTLQYIFIVSCLVALAYPLINVYFIFPSFTKLLIKETEEVAEQVARHFSRVAVSFNKLKEPADFAAEAEELKEEFNLEKMKVFSESGIIIYSSNPEDVGRMNQEVYFHEIVKAGKTYSKIVKKGSTTFEGRIVDADVVETYVPIMKDDRFIGAVEVYYDITLKNTAIAKTVFTYSIIPFSVMFLFLVVVAVILIKAEKITSESSTRELFINYLSPLYLLLISAISIFAAETIVMLFLSVFPPISPVGTAILDATLLIMIVSPVLYFFILRPLKMHINERRRMEDTVRESEEKYRSLVETTEDSFYLVDTEYKYMFMNKKHKLRMEFSNEQIQGKKYSDFHNPEETKIFIEKVDKVFKTGSSIQHEHISNRDGHHFLRTMSPVKEERGGTIAVNVVSKDITELKRYEKELKVSHEQLKELSHHLEEVREDERKNIAREVHDELGQALTALKMDISWMSKKLSRDQGALIEKTRSMTKIINNTLQAVKKISAKLRPSVLDHFGLGAAIEWQADEFQTRTGIQCRVIVEPEDISLNQDYSTAIFRIFQEALTNIARHAEATKVRISLQQEEDMIILNVNDNGKGISKEQISKPKSFGLMGIRERINSLKGDITIHGTPNKGTKIKVVIPIDNKGGIDAENTNS
jgi:PAS domain S-box-containing protein